MRLSGSKRRLSPEILWTAVPALVAAVAALVVAAAGSPAPAEGAMLAVGALALLAGHTWGNLVVVAAHVPLVGHLTFSTLPSAGGALPEHPLIAAVALGLAAVALLPTLVFAGPAAPATLAQLSGGALSHTRATVAVGLVFVAPLLAVAA